MQRSPPTSVPDPFPGVMAPVGRAAPSLPELGYSDRPPEESGKRLLRSHPLLLSGFAAFCELQQQGGMYLAGNGIEIGQDNPT